MNVLDAAHNLNNPLCRERPIVKFIKRKVLRSAVPLLALALSATLTSCLEDLPNNPTPSKQVLPFTAKVYLSQTAGSTQGSPEQAQIDTIDRATTSIILSSFKISNAPIADALIRAHHRGVSVRVKADDSGVGTEYHRLRTAGITIGTLNWSRNFKKFPSIHRYLVIDGRIVWVNSSDFAPNEMVQDDNNTLMLDQSTLAAHLTRHFDGQYDSAAAPTFTDIASGADSATVQPSMITTRMATRDRIEAFLEDQILGARKSIQFLSPELTSTRIADFLSRQAGKGISVKGVIEKDNESISGSQYSALKAKGIDIRLDGNAKTMNHRLLIIDDRMVVLGAFALQPDDKQSQSVFAVQYDTAILAAYGREFTRVFDLAQTAQ